MMAESLQHVLAGAPLHGNLFSRLVTTMPFHQAGIRTQAQLAGMQPDKKLELLSKALKSLAGDSDALNYRLNSLHGQMTILQDMFTQIGSVLRPIGDAIRGPLIQVLKFVTGYFRDHAKILGQQIGDALKNLLQDPKGLLINLLQIKTLGSDVKRSFRMVELFGTFKFIKWILSDLLGMTFNGGLVMAMFRSIWSGVMYLVALVPWAKVLTGIFTVLRAAVMSVLPLFLGFLYIFQVLSRARAIARINDVSALLDLAPKFPPLFLRLKTALENILLPVTMSINYWAQLLSKLFETSFWLKIALPVFELFVFAMEKFGQSVIYALAWINALTYAWVSFFFDVANLNNPFKSLFSNLKKGFKDFVDENHARLGDMSKATANYNVYNNNKIDARFDMREQLEPDRIAFSVTEHLKKLALNPTQGRGQTSGKLFGGGMAAAGNK